MQDKSDEDGPGLQTGRLMQMRKKRLEASGNVPAQLNPPPTSQVPTSGDKGIKTLAPSIDEAPAVLGAEISRNMRAVTPSSNDHPSTQTAILPLTVSPSENAD